MEGEPTEAALGYIVVVLAVSIVSIVGLWKAFTKAGAPGWAAIVPIYNVYVMTKMGDKPWWWILLFLIPIVNIVISVMLCIRIARNFGRSDGFGWGLALLSPIFWAILGFGDARWQRAPVG